MSIAYEESLAEVRALSAGHNLGRILNPLPWDNGIRPVPRAKVSLEFRSHRCGLAPVRERRERKPEADHETWTEAQTVLNWIIEQDRAVTCKEVADRFHMPSNIASAKLGSLVRQDKLDRHGKGGPAHPYTYTAVVFDEDAAPEYNEDEDKDELL
jgi:hypothetical protein